MNKISEKNEELSNRIATLCNHYMKGNSRKEICVDFFEKADCLKPDKGQYLTEYERKFTTFNKISFVNADGKSIVFGTPIKKVMENMRVVLPLFDYIKKNITQEEWFKVISRQKALFATKYYHYIGFEYEYLLSMTESSFYSIKDHLINFKIDKLTEFQKDMVFKKFNKVFESKNVEIRSIITDYLISEKIDDERINGLKILNNSIFNANSKIISCEIIQLKSKDILNVVSWKLNNSYSNATIVLNNLSQSLIKIFESIGIKAIRQNESFRKQSDDVLEILLQKETVYSQSFSSDDIKGLIDRILTETQSMEELKTSKMDIIVNQFLLEKDAPKNTGEVRKTMKF